jgi:hypothetical protein
MTWPVALAAPLWASSELTVSWNRASFGALNIRGWVANCSRWEHRHGAVYLRVDGRHDLDVPTMTEVEQER